jgi:hypothetical protein
MIKVTRKGLDIAVTYYDDFGKVENGCSTFRPTIEKAEALTQSIRKAIKSGKGFIYCRDMAEGLIEHDPRGGKREGAGRPATGRKQRNLQATDEEWEKILKYANEVRGK